VNCWPFTRVCSALEHGQRQIVNLILINHYAGSPRLGMEYRPYYLAREWVKAGHRVQIHAAAYSHVRSQQPVVLSSQPVDEVMDGIHYRWWPTLSYSGNGLGRVRNIWAFLSQLWRNSAQLVREFQPDVVIASSTYPMDIWVARRMAKLARAKLVFEVHDLWPASPIELSGMSKLHPFIMLCQKAENDAYRLADVVVSMLPKVAAHMQSHGLDLRKLHIVPNGVALDDWADEPAPLATEVAAPLRALKAAGHFIVGYAGSHGLPNALDVLLDTAALQEVAAATAPPHAARVHFVLVGDGHEKARLAQRVHAQGLTNVLLLPPVPKAQIPALLRHFDVAYIGWQRVCLYRFGIAPNKLMDYMMAGCAVLHSVEAGNDPVTEAGCGVTVAPESAPAVVAGLQALMQYSAAERAAMGLRGRDFVVAHHSYALLAQQFLAALA
jgi:glycosyltransferase involved in cell wall biosynthesis